MIKCGYKNFFYMYVLISANDIDDISHNNIYEDCSKGLFNVFTTRLVFMTFFSSTAYKTVDDDRLYVARSLVFTFSH